MLQRFSSTTEEAGDKKIIKWLQAARLTCDTTDLLFSAFHQLHLIFRRSDKKKKSLKSLVAFTVI